MGGNELEVRCLGGLGWKGSEVGGREGGGRD